MVCENNMRFVLIGAKSTGKTYYVAKLANKGSKINMMSDETREYLNRINDQIDSGRDPDPTSSGWVELCFGYTDSRYRLNFRLDDFDGAFVENICDDKMSEKIELLLDTIVDSRGLLFLFPYEKPSDIESSSEKFKNIKRGLHCIIEALEKRYPNQKSHIPVVIGVTKWDNSPDFDTTKSFIEEKSAAIAYIKDIPDLNDTLEKIKNYFTQYEVIVFSSIEHYQMQKPLGFFIEKYHENMELKIENLEERKKDDELFKYLSEQRPLLEFYKDGRYKGLYSRLKKRRSRNNFQKLILYISIIALVTIAFIYSQKQRANENEVKLYDKIIYADTNNRIFISDIDRYLKIYRDIDIDHYRSITKIKTKYLVECKKRIEDSIKKLNDITSIKKLYDEILLLENQAQECNDRKILKLIEERRVESGKLLERYNKSIEILNQGDISTIDQGDLLYIVKSIEFISRYSELIDLKSRFINTIDMIVESKNEELIYLISNHLNLLKLPIDISERVIEKKKELATRDEFDELLDDIKSHNFGENAVLLEAYAEDQFSKKQEAKLRRSLQKRFDTAIEEMLKDNLPKQIRNIDDYHRFAKILNDISSLKTNGIVSFLSYKPEFSSENRVLYQKRLTKFSHYEMALQDGVIPKHIAFITDSENNEPLGFSCYSVGSDDDIELDIDGRKYDEDDSVCEGMTITYKNSYRYSSGSYKGKAVEWDPLSNDTYSFSFKLTENDIIKLQNGKSIKKNIGSSYMLVWIP